ncbi:RidA family protein [Flavobacterium sp.]|uniref:RidA family protein n=1 Tax=Flavobacterium sp. TaxID=239 RepID=UPI00120EC7F6|nr:RidA family protein [Flavobacterium sp.]RZJ69713.1 MAG: RidA family protein [Flavobacterium sp.]
MEKTHTNPWKWQDARNYVQAVEVKNVTGTLYVSGQTAISDDGISSDADMRTQIALAIANLEKVITQAGYEVKNIARLNIFTTDHDEFFNDFDVFQDWVSANGIKTTITCLQVVKLFETLKVELEATVVN